MTLDDPLHVFKFHVTFREHPLSDSSPATSERQFEAGFSECHTEVLQVRESPEARRRQTEEQRRRARWRISPTPRSKR